MRRIYTLAVMVLLVVGLGVAGPDAAVAMTCGDGLLDPGLLEQCDDGGTADGDGCSSTCQIEPTPQAKEQQACINSRNKSLAKIVKARDGDTLRCAKELAKDKIASAVVCRAADEKDKVAKAKAKLADDDARKCAGAAPDFGVGRLATVGVVGTSGRTDAIAALYGPDLDAALASIAGDPTTAKCQQAVAKSLAKCGAALRKEFNKCAKKGLKDGSVARATELEACFGDDGSGKIAKACDPLTGTVATKAIAKKCGGVTLSTAFPGCATDDPAELALCVDRLVRCRTCTALNAASRSSRDCELADDGAINGSCSTGDFLALSYNVAGLPEGISSSEPLTNTPLISPLLNDYDLVVVQESWQTPDPNPLDPLRVYHELLVADANHLYKSVSAPLPLGMDPSRPSALVSDGLNRFSRVPFDPVTRVAWDGCHNTAADCLAFKGFSFSRTTLAPGVQVDVYNLHMEAGGDPEDEVLRDEGMTQVLSFMQANSAGRAVIIGGDFNLHTDEEPDATTYQRLLDDEGMTDVCAALACPEPARIDKWAFRSSAALTIEPTSWQFDVDVFVRGDGEPLSDHDPLAVHFLWSSD